MMILLFLLFLSRNDRLGPELSSFLRFYRENRDLLTAFISGNSASATGSASAPSEPSAPARAQPSPAEEEQKESRPPERTGNLDILESFLKRRSL